MVGIGRRASRGSSSRVGSVQDVERPRDAIICQGLPGKSPSTIPANAGIPQGRHKTVRLGRLARKKSRLAGTEDDLPPYLLDDGGMGTAREPRGIDKNDRNRRSIRRTTIALPERHRRLGPHCYFGGWLKRFESWSSQCRPYKATAVPRLTLPGSCHWRRLKNGNRHQALRGLFSGVSVLAGIIRA